MNLNPFVSKTYQETWLRHFERNSAIIQFDFIPDIKFIKKRLFPFYINSGRNYTNAITYTINDKSKDFKGKVFLIYDVPNFSVRENNNNKNELLRIIKIQQYKGCRLNLKGFSTFSEYFDAKFNSKFKKNYRQRINRLERTHETKYIQYFDHIEKSEYTKIMNSFHELLKRRYGELEKYNNIIDDWDFYVDLVYPLILEKKVVINTIHIDNQIAALSLKFLSEESIIGAVRTFDIEYKSHNIGIIEQMKIIEWAIDNKIGYFDLSKGVQEYKKKFLSEIYNFECHIVYDSKSIRATLIAKSLGLYFKLKQRLRDLKINVLYTKILFNLKKITR